MARRRQYRAILRSDAFPTRVEDVINAGAENTPGMLVEDVEATVRDPWRRQAELTSQLKAEEEDRSAHEMLTKVVPVALSIANDRGEVEFLNDRFIATFGYTLEDVPTLQSWREKVFPDEKYRAEVAVGMEKVFRETLHGRPEMHTPELTVTCKDGSKRIIIISISRFGRRYAAVFNDVTECRLAEEKTRQSLAALQNALEGCIKAAAKMVELRDPYTAGHQQRVARLVKAVAQKLRLPAQQIDYLSMAASVHDIGKIYIPAEILNRTGKLTGPEYAMIQGHVQGGYTILSNIQFPWPIAKIVLQHHERLDGSGYPAGLTAEQIMLEAKILGVADTVEAMSAHRPYRPTLGQQEALNEITRNKGTTYDPAVVEACLSVLQEVGWDLMDTP